MGDLPSPGAQLHMWEAVTRTLTRPLAQRVQPSLRAGWQDERASPPGPLKAPSHLGGQLEAMCCSLNLHLFVFILQQCTYLSGWRENADRCNVKLNSFGRPCRHSVNTDASKVNLRGLSLFPLFTPPTPILAPPQVI